MLLFAVGISSYERKGRKSWHLSVKIMIYDMCNLTKVKDGAVTKGKWINDGY